MYVAPNHFVIGFPRTGTTTLYEYLKSPHSGVRVGFRKATNYHELTFNAIRRAHIKLPQNRYSYHGRMDYESNYESDSVLPAVDISPSYIFDGSAIGSIKKEVDDPNIVIIIREPLSYIRSMAWNLKVNRYISSYSEFDEIHEISDDTYKGFPRRMLDLISHIDQDRLIKPWIETFRNCQIVVYEHLHDSNTDYAQVISELFPVDEMHGSPGYTNTSQDKRLVRVGAGTLHRYAARLLGRNAKQVIKNVIGNKDNEEEVLNEFISRMEAVSSQAVDRLLGLLRSNGQSHAARQIQDYWLPG